MFRSCSPRRPLPRLPTPGGRVRALPPGRLLEEHAPTRLRARETPQGGSCTPASPTPPPRATTLRTQERNARHLQRSLDSCRAHAQEIARPAARQAWSATPGLLPPAGCRRDSRLVPGAALLLVLWLALGAFPWHRGQRGPGNRGQGPSPRDSSASLPPDLRLRRAAGDRHGCPCGQGDPQEHPRRQHLGRGLARQVSLLPAHLSPPGRVADAGPRFVAGNPDRRLAASAAVVRAGLPKVDRTEPEAEALARR